MPMHKDVKASNKIHYSTAFNRWSHVKTYYLACLFAFTPCTASSMFRISPSLPNRDSTSLRLPWANMDRLNIPLCICEPVRHVYYACVQLQASMSDAAQSLSVQTLAHKHMHVLHTCGAHLHTHIQTREPVGIGAHGWGPDAHTGTKLCCQSVRVGK